MEFKTWENEYPSPSEYAHFYSDYVSLVPRSNIIHTLNTQMHDFYTFINSIPGDKALAVYKQGKWTIKEIVGHLIETERVFTYRALCFSRGDRGPLPGINQNEWMKENNYNSRTLNNLVNEYLAVRVATTHLFKTLNKEMITKSGTADGLEFSVRALAFIIAGHEIHHLNIIKEKYLQ